MPRPSLEPQSYLLICDRWEAAMPPCPTAPAPSCLPGAEGLSPWSMPRAPLPCSLLLIHVLSPCPGNLEQAMQAEAVLSAGRLELERLRLRLAVPGALAGQLSLLRDEAARQREKIQAFESDLAEIRADRQNLEDILRSLPEGCSKWQ